MPANFVTTFWDWSSTATYPKKNEATGNQSCWKKTTSATEEAWKDPEYQRKVWKEELIAQIGYVIEPQDLYYSAMVAEIEKGRTKGNFTMWKCSRKPSARLKNPLWDMTAKRISITCLMIWIWRHHDWEIPWKPVPAWYQKSSSNLNELDFMHEDAEIDVLGMLTNTWLASLQRTQAKRQENSTRLNRFPKILAKNRDRRQNRPENVYDPTCGSGSLLLRIGNEANVRHYYDKELNSTTYNLARMNMLLHEVSFQKFWYRIRRHTGTSTFRWHAVRGGCCQSAIQRELECWCEVPGWWKVQ